MNILKKTEKRDSAGSLASRVLSLIMLLASALSLGACDAGEIINGNTETWSGYRKESFYLNTICDITIYRIDLERAAAAAENGAAGSDDGKSLSPSTLSDSVASDALSGGAKTEGSGGEIEPEADNAGNLPEQVTEEELKAKYDEIISDCFKLIADYERMLSKTVDGSDIDRINRSAGIPIQVDKETIEVIKKGIEFGELSGGMFDITIGKASELWNFTGDDEGIGVGNASDPSADDDKKNESAAGEPDTGETDVIPEQTALGEAIRHIDYRKIAIDEKTGYIKLRDPKMEIDLGGIAKGYIADRAADFLRERGVISGVVNLGGNIVAIGGKALSESYEEAPDENLVDFNLGIINPLSENGELLGSIPARDVTVVTSGTYERYVEKDGVRYHHILDPETGFPVDTELVQVSIIAEAGHSVDCDGLSTACLALGVKDGTALIDKLNSSEKYGRIEAIFLDGSGNVSLTNPDTAFTLSRKN